MIEELSPAASASPPPSRGTWSGAASAQAALDEYFGAASESPQAPIEAQTRAFEELLEKRAASSPGPYLDAESLRAMYRGMFYSALINVATFRIDRRGSAEADVFTRAMGNPPPGTATQIRDWLLEQAVLDRSAKIPDDIVARLESWDRVGTWPPHKIVQDVRGRTASADDPIRRAMVRVMFRRLDTRRGGLEEAARSARFELRDLPLSERYLAGLMREDPVTGGDLVVYAASWSRDVRKLRALANDPKVGSRNRALAFRLLKDIGEADSRALEAGFRALVDEHPLDTELLDGYFDFCIAADDPKAAEDAVDRWLNRKPPPDRDLLWAHFVARRARALAKQKKWREAWSTIEPVVGTWKGDVLESASSILEEEGAWDEALAWAKRTDERYPGNDRVQASVARILWRQRRYADAAEYLAAPGRVRPRAWTWQLPPAFVEAFEKADPHETQAAFTALRERGINASGLAQIARVVGIHGDHRLSFSLLQQIAPSARAEDAARLIWAAGELEKVDGADAAAEWLRSQARDPHQLALVAFQFQQYDLLQTPFEDPARARKVEEIELLRTAALLMTPGENATRQAELRRYFGDRKNSEWAPYALYMLDALPDPDFLSKPTREDTLANVGWFAGLKAARLGRYEEASDWFEVAVHTDQMRMPPQAWAFEMLDRWKDQSKALALFTPEDAFVVGKH